MSERAGGATLVRMKKFESWESVSLLQLLIKFSDVQLVKSLLADDKRAFFFNMIATHVRPQHEEAFRGIQRWKQLCNAITFGTEEEFPALSRSFDLDDNEVLMELGPRLVSMGKVIWETLARAISRAPFMQHWQNNREFWVERKRSFFHQFL